MACVVLCISYVCNRFQYLPTHTRSLSQHRFFVVPFLCDINLSTCHWNVVRARFFVRYLTTFFKQPTGWDKHMCRRRIFSLIYSSCSRTLSELEIFMCCESFHSIDEDDQFRSPPRYRQWAATSSKLQYAQELTLKVNIRCCIWFNNICMYIDETILHYCWSCYEWRKLITLVAERHYIFHAIEEY